MMTVFLLVLAAAAVGLIVSILLILQRRHVGTWLGNYLKQDWRAPVPEGTTRHLMFCFVDHYEPGWASPSYETECKRVARWRQDYPKLCEGLRDADGRAPIHSFFYPEEEYRREHLDALVDLCRMGLGEIEIHLHHDHDT